MRIHNFAFAVALSLLGYSGIAHAEADTFGLGTGRDGAKTVTSAAGEVINTYAPVTTALAVGGKTVTLGARVGASANFTVGQVVMIHQDRNGFVTPPVSASGASLDLAGTKTGRYELARIATVAGNDVTFTHGTVNAFDANDTQLVSVPEFTTVGINLGAKIVPAKWNGTTGGIVAFLATGAVTNAGSIDASASGFRAAVFINSPDAIATGNPPHQCAANDGIPGEGNAAGGGGHKGEGLDGTAFSTSATFVAGSPRHYGRGNVGNGGGGGDCFNAGGGGGGHGGTGGGGGNTNTGQDSNRPVGGTGGVVVAYNPSNNLAFGGAGGAGEGDDSVGGDGGAGGGVIWMRADSLLGTGTFNANGAPGETAGHPADTTVTDGAGGGGAGGGVFAWFNKTAVCVGITATGGNGGDATPTVGVKNYGPGGGGGGGRVQLAASGGICVVTVTAGVSGATGLTKGGSTNGGNGTTATPGAFTTTTCAPVTGMCGGCTADAFCTGAKPKCDLTAGSATIYQCIAAPVNGQNPYGQPPANGAQCTAGATPTQGTSAGCINNLCDTKDNLCGYANGTTCGSSNQCRSNFCGADLKCAVATSGDGGVTDGGTTDGGSTTNDGGSGGRDSGPIDDGNGDDTGTTDTEGVSLEGGGCSSAGSTGGSLAALGGMIAMVGSVIRRRRRR